MGLRRGMRWGTMAALLGTASAMGAAELSPTGLSHSCNSCHGPGGHSPGAIPPIDGMPRDQFLSAMRDFKSGERTGTIMDRIARAYSEEEIAVMAEYYAAQEGGR